MDNVQEEDVVHTDKSLFTNNITRNLLTPTISAGLSALLLLLFMRPVCAAERQVVQGHVPAAIKGMASVERLSASRRLALAIALPLRNQAALSKLLAQIYDPASPQYRQYLTPEQFTERFGPTEEDYAAVVAFAKANGLTVSATHPNRVLLDVNASVADIEKAFHVIMRVYQHPKEARTFYAPDAEPSLDLAVPVLHISGLDNYSLPRPRLAVTPIAKSQNATPNAGSGFSGTFMARDFRAAYVPGTPLTGAGQAVGLLQFDGYAASDIAYYIAANNLSSVTLSNVLLDGFSGVPTGNGGEVEVCLDIEMTLSMAPGISTIYVYEAGPSGLWHDILNRMAHDNLAKQLSCSWYIPGGTMDTVADGIFQQMAAQGQSFYSASGDYDAFCGLIPFPGDTPYITQVGGTLLSTAGPGGAWTSERAWNRNDGVGSGGGISTQYAIPSWQQGLSMVANLGSTTMRNVPDVAFTADQVYVRADGMDQNEGGTSAAAPLWAGFTALVNQQAAANGRPTVGFVNPAIYTLGQTASYGAAFHDITVGNNTNTICGSARFPAVAGYDLATGWGTPTGQALINALAGPPDALEITPLTGFTSSGGAGGPFTFTSESLTLTNAGTNVLTWSLVNTSLWLNVSPSGGTLTPGGVSAAVTASLNSVASNLVAGSYSATIWFTNLSSGIGQDRTFTLTVLGAPVISSQPASQSVLAGTAVTFSVGAIGLPPLYYQWTFFGTNLPAGTNQTLAVPNVTTNQAGNYYAVVSNSLGSATSAVAVLTILPGPVFLTGSYLYLPIQTNGVFLAAHTGAKFNPAGTGGASGVDFWEPGTPVYNTVVGVGGINYVNGSAPVVEGFTSVSVNNLSSGSLQRALISGVVIPGLSFSRDISFATNSKAIRIVDTLQNTGAAALFNIVTLDTADPDQDSAAPTNSSYLTLNDVVSVNQANDLVVATGPSTGLSVGFGSDSGLQIPSAAGFNNTNAYTLMSVIDPNGASGDIDINLVQNYGTLAAGQSQSMVWYLVFGVSKAEVLTNFALAESFDALQITPVTGFSSSGGAGGPFTVTSQSLTLTNAGTNALTWSMVNTSLWLNVSPAGGTLTPGEASATVTASLNSVASNLLVGNYSTTVWFTNLSDNVGQSRQFTLSIISPPTITLQPTNQTVADGVTATFTVGISGGLPLYYQWQANSNNLTDGGHIYGSSTTTLSVSNVGPANAASYRLIVTNAAGMAISSNALLVALPGNVDHFAWGIIPSPEVFNQPFAVNITALDPANVIATNFSGVVNITGFANGSGGTSNLVIQTADSITNSVLSVLNSLGSQYDFVQTNTLTSLNLSNYNTIILGMDGGEVDYASMAYLATAVNAGAKVIFLGGSEWLPFAAGLNDFFIQINTNDYAWTTVVGSPDLSVTAPANPLATGIPLTYSFINLYASYYMARVIDGSAVTVATNGDGFACLTTKIVGAGGVVLFINAAYDSFWSNPGDSNVLRAVISNALQWAETGGIMPIPITPTHSGSFVNGVWTGNIVVKQVATNAALTANDGAGHSGSSNPFSVIYSNQPPIITLQPSNQTLPAGFPATFTVAAVGSPPLSYYWSRNGTIISGATNASYTTNNVQLADTGNQFSCLVSNAYGTTNSRVATLTVLAVPPSITQQPANQTVSAGGTAGFTVMASGSLPLSYFWKRNGGLIPGATNSTYATNNVQLADSGSQFSCLVSNAYGTMLSSNAGLTVITLPTDWFTELFGTSITSLAFKTYTFTPNGSANFYSVCSQTTAAFPTDPTAGTVLSLNDDSYSQVTLSGGNTVAIYGNRANGIYVGSNGYLTMNAGDTSFSPSYTSHFVLPRVSALYRDLNPGAGGTVSWKQLADHIAVTYQGVPIFGSSTQTNSFQVELFFDGRIRITYLSLSTPTGLVGLSEGTGQPHGFIPSDFTSYPLCGPAGVAPTITVQPASITNVPGFSATFCVTATGTAPLSFWWQRNSTPIAGATASCYTISDVQLSDSGSRFSCLVSNAYGAALSSSAVLTVLPQSVDHFQWSSIPSPQATSVPFAASISALDQFNNIVSNFTGNVVVNGWTGSGPTTNRMFSGITPNNSGAGTYTWGYSFTPTNNLLVTHVRNTFGTQVSLWTASGTLLASQSVVSSSGTWSEAALAVPVPLVAGSNYVVAAYVNANAYYWVTSLTGGFSDGTIATASLFTLSESFPTNTATGAWPLVGLRYTVATASQIAITPTNTSPFVNGAWSGSVTVPQPATNVFLSAGDGAGHSGTSNPFDVIGLLPAIISQPINQSVPVGGIATFSATASGAAPMRYLWRHNGTPIAGATQSSCTHKSEPSDEGSLFSCLVSNTYGWAASSNAVLTVTLPSLVQNGGFELGNFTDWTEGGNFYGCWVTNVLPYVHLGLYGTQLGPDESLGYLSQTIPTSIGQTYLISCWLNSDGNTPNEFLVSWNGSTLFDGSNLAANGWTNLKFMALATSTTTVLGLGFRDDPGYLGLDDISVVPVSPPQLQAVAHTNGSIAFAWPAMANVTYQVQYQTNLSQTDWINWGSPIVGNNSLVTITDLTGGTKQRFYRLRLLP